MADAVPQRSQNAVIPRLALVVLLAFALRLIAVTFRIDESLHHAKDHWSFGWETGRLARSLAAGNGYSSPLFGQTGPSAWLAPMYPMLLAGVFKIFGIYSAASAWVIFTLNCVLSSLTCLPVHYIGRTVFGPRMAIFAALAWAVFPYDIQFASGMVWSVALTPMLLATAIALTIALERKLGAFAWAAWGAQWGLIGLTEPSCLTCLAVAVVWLIFCLRRRGAPWAYFRHVGLAAFVFLIVVSPWFVRNYRVFGRFVPFREGFGLVLYEGNTWDTFEIYPLWAAPQHNPDELAEYARLGEIAYMAKKQRQGFGEIVGHPGRFVLATFRRFAFTWTGYWDLSPAYRKVHPLVLLNIVPTTTLSVFSGCGLVFLFRRRSRFAMLFAMSLVTFPAVYYITQTSNAYRHPIDPLLVLLAVSVFFRAEAAETRQSEALAFAAVPVAKHSV